MSDTDRASCKLNCTSTRRAKKWRQESKGERTQGSGPVSSAPQAAPSAGTVSSAPPSAGTSGAGYTTVIEEAKSPAQIAACQMGCDQAGLGPTDRATCKLNCAATTRIVHVVPAGPPGTTGPTTAGPSGGPGASTPSSAGAAAPNPSSGAALAACYDSCASLAASDHVTCKLNCESAHRVRVSAPVPAPPAVQRPGAQPSSSVVHRPSGDPAATAACERSCDTRTDLSDTDRATCKLGCSRHTTVVVEQWTSSAPKSATECQSGCQCRDRCLGHQHTCEASCSGKSGSDAATCKLQCEAIFDSCHDACKVDGCSCSATAH